MAIGLVSRRGLPMPLFYAYMAGTHVARARQCMVYAREEGRSSDWKCGWVKQARETMREARNYMRMAKGEK